jgi:hypothetical protein
MKSAFDSAPAKSLSAFVLIYEGKYAGRIVAAHGESLVRATVHIYGGPLANMPATTGTARGYGYCKLSAAIADAFIRWREGKSTRPEVEPFQPGGGSCVTHVPVPFESTVPGAVRGLELSSGVGISAIREHLESVGYSFHQIV